MRPSRALPLAAAALAAAVTAPPASVSAAVTAVDFRSQLAAEAGTSRAIVASGLQDLTARHVVARGKVALSGAGDGAQFAKGVVAEDVDVTGHVQGRTLKIDTLYVDEIVATGALAIEGLLGTDDVGVAGSADDDAPAADDGTNDDDGSTTVPAAFLEVASAAVLPPADAVVYDGSRVWDAAAGWRLRPTDAAAQDARGPSSLRRASSAAAGVRLSTCGAHDNILGGPCQTGGGVELMQTWAVQGSARGEGASAGRAGGAAAVAAAPGEGVGGRLGGAAVTHCGVCVEFAAHFFDLWPRPAGADVVYAAVDGAVVWLDSHASPAPRTPARDRAPSVCGHPALPDTKLGRRARVCVPHAADTVTLTFGAVVHNRTADACEQSWGVSDVRVTASPCGPQYW